MTPRQYRQQCFDGRYRHKAIGITKQSTTDTRLFQQLAHLQSSRLATRQHMLQMPD